MGTTALFFLLLLQVSHCCFFVCFLCLQTDVVLCLCRTPTGNYLVMHACVCVRVGCLSVHYWLSLASLILRVSAFINSSFCLTSSNWSSFILTALMPLLL